MLSKEQARQILATLHTKSNEEKLALLIKLKQLRSAKRRQEGERSLSVFITTYLQELAPQARPLFHDDMIGLMDRVAPTVAVSSLSVLQSPTTPSGSDTGSKTLPIENTSSIGHHDAMQGEGEGGGDPPAPARRASFARDAGVSYYRPLE